MIITDNGLKDLIKAVELKTKVEMCFGITTRETGKMSILERKFINKFGIDDFDDATLTSLFQYFYEQGLKDRK